MTFIQNGGTVTAPVTSWKFWTQRRYVLTLLVFLGYFNIYALRVNMSIAIVAMTQDRYVSLDNGTQINVGPNFSWNNKIQGYVLSSFFYGYLTTQLLGGILARKFGGKWIFGGGIASTALITLISPWLAELSVFALLSARILMGAFEGVTFSSLYTIWASWIPPPERSRVTSQANSGSYTGAVFSMSFFAYLAEAAGWKSIFWFSGGLGLLWVVAWLYFISESPEKDSRITKEELQYIQLSLDEVNPSETDNVQWKNLLTSKAAWAINVALFCETWGFYTLLTLLPKYFKDVFQFDISKSGILSALPYVAIAIMMQLSGQLADRIVLRGWLTITQVRKTFMAIGFLSQTCFMMGAAYWGEASGTVFCLVMAVGLGSLAISTISVNALDVAPHHSGMLFGVANTWGTVPGVISPVIAGYVISTENPTVEQWRVVFYITAGLYLFGAIFYTISASGLRQAWDVQPQTRQRDNSAIPEVDSKMASNGGN